MDKTLIIVLDEFTESVFEYSNVTLYDYGFIDEITFFDYVSNGIGTADETRTTFVADEGGFYRVTPDDFEYSFERDLDFKEEATVEFNGQEAVATTYFDFFRAAPTPQDFPAHGDWVIEAITQRLVDPSRTEIIAIDVAQEFLLPFQNVTTTFDGVEYVEPAMIAVVFDFLQTFDAAFNAESDITYLPAALSVSLGDNTVDESELTTLDYFELFEVPIFQASANEGQEGVDWGSVYQNVINVGAWNVATNGELLLSSFESLPNVDLAGDGLVFRDDWGFNFGTSFATPKIAAEFINLANDVISDLNAQGSRVADFFDTTYLPPSYSQLVATAIPSLTSDVLITFDDPNAGLVLLPISDATLAENGVTPRTLEDADTGLTGSTIALLEVLSDSTSPTGGRDFLTGGEAGETLTALDGNDTLSGLGGDDVLNGGAGVDTAIFSGPQFAYTLLIGPGETRIADRRPDVNGTDTLVDIEFLDFTVDIQNGPFNLQEFGGVASLSPEDFESFIELYIAYFNRAPDAIGLNFWGTAFANGTTLEQMATLFIDQEETRATYPEGTSNTEFATSVYNNVLGRTPDAAGIEFWVGFLDSGAVSRDQFILEVLRGAKSELKPEEGQAFVDQQMLDRAFLENKVDIGAYFAVHRGMSDVSNATEVMALFDGSQDSIAQAFAAIDADYQAALDPELGEFLVQVIGVLDPPAIA
jgi:Ca2+-binding RTX toxin-like protein